MNRFGVISILATIVLGPSARAAQPASDAMDRLAVEKGCYLCHTAKSAPRKRDEVLPHAPSWSDVAAKYKGRRDAEELLTRIVLRGSWDEPGNRHWQGKVGDVGMPPNVPQIDSHQARELVRWILAFPR